MEHKVLLFLAGFAFLLTLILTPLMRPLALRLNIVDLPDARKIHTEPMPYLGGLAMYIAIVFGCALAAFFFPELLQEKYFALVAGLTIIALVGAVDDIVGLTAWVKLPFQALAAAVVCGAGFQIDEITNPFFGGITTAGWFTWPATILWIVAITNAINLLDGLDGLAAGVVCIAAAANLVTALAMETVPAAVLYALIIGVCLGFLRYNFHPARIFMGDMGSLQLGFLLAVTALLGSKSTMIFSLLPVGLPVIDVLLVIVRRSRLRRNVFHADREHLHHRLLRIGLSHRSVVGVYYILSLYLGLSAIVMAQLQRFFVLVMFLIYCMGILIGWSILRFIEAQVSRRLEALNPAQGGAPPP